MRSLLLLLIAAATFALPASAANLNPRSLVLSEVDVPAHYEFDKDNSTVFPSELATAYAGGRPVTGVGYVNGYLASYLNVDPPRWHHIASAAFVFRRAEGARKYLAWFDKQFTAHNAVRRSSVDIGEGGWIYVSHSRDTGTHVLWRSGRVVGLVLCEWMTPHRALALSMAPRQQRRIAAALR